MKIKSSGARKGFGVVVCFKFFFFLLLYLCIGCTESSLLPEGFSLVAVSEATLSCFVLASHCRSLLWSPGSGAPGLQ